MMVKIDFLISPAVTRATDEHQPFIQSQHDERRRIGAVDSWHSMEVRRGDHGVFWRVLFEFFRRGRYEHVAR